MTKRGSVEKCTFCGKSRHMVESLIAGPPHIYICNECVELCNSILAEESRRGRDAVDTDLLGAKEDLLTPRQINGLLDDYVISQERARYRKGLLFRAPTGHRSMMLPESS